MLASYEKNFAVVGEGEKPVEVAVKEEPRGLSEYTEKPVVLQPDGIDRMTHAQLKEKAKSMGLKFQGNPSFDSLKKAIKEAGK